jgi:trimeric autotransporter adhesin
MTGEREDGRIASAAGLGWAKALKLGLFAGASALTIASLALANPQGGEVVSGQATITTPSATQTTVTQSSDKAIIDWKSFNIGTGESTIFVQPNSNSVALNRIFDNDPSVIAGLLSANGKLILINRNGLMFDSGAVINTAGLIATTSDIGNEDFMAGRLNFTTPGNANAQISNKGLITAEEGGIVAFVAPSVKNSGVITARLGRVALGAGNTFVLDLYGDNLISFPVSAEIAQQLVDADGKPLTSLVDVSGKIEAGSVQLTARAARGLIDNVINVDGEIIASGIRQSSGTTFLTGGGPLNGNLEAGHFALIGGAAPSVGAGGVVGTYGGAIVIDGGANGVSVGGSLNASGGNGGSIKVSGENVIASGSMSANGSGGAGGSVSIVANNFAALSGSISANGASGGSIDVTSANNLLTAGSISANGSNGAGGTVSLTAANRQIATSATQVSASGATGGGSISVRGGDGLFTSGSYDATSSAGQGGTVTVGGRDIKMIDSKVDASGAAGGGAISVGFTGAGDGRAISADKILVSPTSTFKADATGNGHGGSVVFWSNLATDFMGTISAKGGSLSGNGGFLEVSSKGSVGFWGVGDASAINGSAGSLTLDPKDIIVSATGSIMPSYELIEPGAGAATFGANVAALSSGNTVVTSSGDDTAANNAGAVFVFNTTTGALVSMVTGSRADDAVGNGGITLLSSGNFVVASAAWDNGAGATDAGAVTFGNGTTGVSGVVSAANSLVGSATNNQVGNGGVVALSNGNYAVVSSNWDNGATTNVGAVTWGNGATGTVGSVSAANSLIGSQTNDNVGSGGVVALTNGNYVVRSMLWNNGGTADAGAVTWGNGLGGTVGAVSAANSLVGSSTNDNVGSSGVTALTNGNYVVASSLWNNGGSTDAGAATWGNGLGGTVGTISAANSYVGGASNNNVGSGGVVALSNGHYAIVSPNWDNGGNTNVGAVTWGNGTTGTSGTVGTGNSLYGANGSDAVGSGGVFALTNGNYVVASPNFDTGPGNAQGAVTWRSGAAGSGAQVAAANSLFGSNSNDNIGSGGVVALSSGNYVVVSPNWDNGGTGNVGAVTWGNGTTGTTGTVGAANSTVGTATNDSVGSGGVFALTNGNYVISSPVWNNGGTTDAGAVTWRNGSAVAAGTLSAANSLIGSSTNDNVGNLGVTALTNGNYVVRSSLWNNGGTTDAGAVTWGNGATGVVGTISAANSLIGAAANDQVGSGNVLAISGGRYLVSSPQWNNGGTADAGAVTLGSAAGDTVGTVSSANSMIGLNANAQMSATGLAANGEILARSTASGFVLVGLTDPNQLTFARAQGQTLTVNPTFLTRTLNTGTAVSLQASNDLTITSAILVNNPSGNGGALTLQAGRSIFINADITTDNGNLTILANELLSAGVINAQRDPGSAVISMGVGADIIAGSGAVRLAILSGAGKTNFASGDMTLRSISAGTILAENLGLSNGDIIIASGSLSATGSGTPLVVASQGGDFINNAGAGALSAPNGRWLVYSQTPTANTIGGLAGSPYYNTPYNPANPTGLSAAGNRFAYTVAPVLAVTPNNQSRPYGDPNSGLTYSVSGLIGGDTLAGAVQGAPELQTTATQLSTVGSGPYPITATIGTLASNYNYSFTFGSGLLTISPAQLFYLADSKSREYGDPNGTLTGTLSGLKNGETIEDVTDGTATFTSLADNFSNVGQYLISGSGLSVTSANYEVTILQSSASATALNVVPAQLFYVATPVVRDYGDFNPDITGTVSGLKNGESLGLVTSGILDFATSATQASNVGTYAIVGGGLTVEDSNYAVTILQAAGNATALTINPAQLFYRAFGSSRVYGDAEETYDGELIGLRLNDQLADVVTGTAEFTTTATITSNVGLHAINGSGLTVINGNYSLAILQEADNATALEITPAQLTYVADAATRIYGDANPAFTGQVVGLKNGEALNSVTSGTLLFTSSATAASNVGDYDINGGGLTVTSGNYFSVIEQDDANATALTINPAQLFYLADAKSRIYGDANPALTGQVTGLKNGDALEDVTDGTLAFETNADAGDDVGLYAITGTGLTVVNGNYEIDIFDDTFNDTALSITPAQLYFLANSASRIYGDANPDFTGDIIGLKNGEQYEDVSDGELVFTTGASETSNVGSYAINGGGITNLSSNYISTILQDPSNATALTITKAQLSYVANAASREYGDANPTFTGTLAGLKNGESIGSVASGSMTFLSPATPTTSLGNYAILGGGLTVTSGNYFSAIDQDPSNATALTITPAQLFYVADTKSKIYGQVNPVFTGTLQGLKNGETLEVVTDGTLVWVSQATNGSDAGTYDVLGEGLTVVSGNYLVDILQAPGNEDAFTINQAQLTFRADLQSRIYGFPNPALTGELLGLVNGDSIENAVDGDLVFTTNATEASLAGYYAINGGGVVVDSPNYITTILQDPSNATAFRIIGVPLTTTQTQQEGEETQDGAIDDAKGSTSSRSNELNIVGVGPVSDDMADGKNDEMADQLCVLGAPEVATSANCNARKAAGQ